MPQNDHVGAQPFDGRADAFIQRGVWHQQVLREIAPHALLHFRHVERLRLRLYGEPSDFDQLRHK
jgi:hypothetical protein